MVARVSEKERLTFVDDTLEACYGIRVSNGHRSQSKLKMTSRLWIGIQGGPRDGTMKPDLRITLNSRLATAAAAMVQRMMMRSMPRVFLPPSPFKKGSKPVVAMIGDENVLFRGCVELSLLGQKTRCSKIGRKVSRAPYCFRP